jgi:hypothetical protein
MTPETIAQAMTEITALFINVWGTRPCDYPNVAFKIKDVSEKEAWARFRLQHNEGGQRTLAGNDGKSRHGRKGNVIVEVHSPIGTGVKDAYALAESVKNAFEGKRTASGVWFRNVRINEVNDTTLLWYPIVVIADFDYEQYN